VLALLVPAVSLSQSITPNYQGAEVAQIAEAVGVITGKNFIIDPRVKSQVTMVSSVPMTPDEFYNAFLSILQVHGFMAIPDGPNTLRIVPGIDVPGNSKVRYLKYADAEKLLDTDGEVRKGYMYFTLRSLFYQYYNKKKKVNKVDVDGCWELFDDSNIEEHKAYNDICGLNAIVLNYTNSFLL